MKRNLREISEFLYIPEHLMGVEARTSLGRSPRQITMADDLSIRKHLMKDRQQIGQLLRLSRRAGVFPYSLTESDKRYVDKIMTIVLRYEE